MNWPLRSTAWGAMTWVSLALAGLVGMAETGAVVQEATPTGQYPPHALFGLGQLTAPASPPTALFAAWARAAAQFTDLRAWLLVYLGFNVLFVTGYYLLGRLVLHGDTAGRRLLIGLAALTLVQDAIAALTVLIWIRPHRAPWAVVAWLLHFVIIVKWAAAIALITRVVYWAWRTDDVRRQIRRIGRALKVQRFSVVIVAMLAVLAISRGSDVLEQFPDVARAWLTWPPSLGWVQWAAAATAEALVAVFLLYLGRLRVKRAQVVYTNAPDQRDHHRYTAWLVTPAVLLVLAVILQLTGGAQVSWLRAIAIPLVLWVIAGASWLIERVPAFRPQSRLFDPRDPREVAALDDQETVNTVRTVGDLLAVAAVAIPGVGLVRAFTAPALVAAGGYAVASWLAVAIGVAVAAGCWPVANGPLRLAARHLAGAQAGGWHPAARMARWASRGSAPWPVANAREEGWGTLWPTLAAAAPFLVLDVMLIFVPLWTTHWLGPFATAVIAFGTLGVGLAMLAFLAQSHNPLPVFRLLRLQATPVITIIVIILIVGAELDKNPKLHEIRLPARSALASATASPAAETELLASLQHWLADPATTTRALPPPGGGRAGRVEPLVLVAGAGGGIRAAWWTAHALATLAATPCGRHGVFAVSSVSGSSLGLTVMATTSRYGPAMSRLAGPDALAAVFDGLLLRDMVAGTTGLNLIAAQMPPGHQFPDRAALMESAWEAEDPALKEPFPLSHPVLPWRLLLNTTAVRTGCRAIIADRVIGSTIKTPASLTCTPGSAAPAADSYDLFAALPCLRGINTATAALLSARFPYVTPAGSVSGCIKEGGTQVASGTQVEQYVDGGYTDGTGLSTLADLAPSLMTAIRQYDARAVTSTPVGQPVTVVVPVTVYVGNGTQPEPVVGGIPTGPPEPLIPLVSNASSAMSQLVNSTASLQRLATETSVGQLFSCAPGNTRCALAEAAVTATVPNQLIVVVPRTRPRISAPLGWVLSQASRTALNDALDQEADGICGRHMINLRYCPVGVGRLGDLFRLTHHTPS